MFSTLVTAGCVATVILFCATILLYIIPSRDELKGFLKFTSIGSMLAAIITVTLLYCGMKGMLG